MSEKHPTTAEAENPFSDRARRFLYEVASKYTHMAVRWPETARDRTLVEGLLRTPRMVRQPTMSALNLALDCELDKYLPVEPPRYAPGMAVVCTSVENYISGEVAFIAGGVLGWDCAVRPSVVKVGPALPGDRPDDTGIRLATREELIETLRDMSDDTAERVARLVVVGVLSKKNKPEEDPFGL